MPVVRQVAGRRPAAVHRVTEEEGSGEMKGHLGAHCYECEHVIMVSEAGTPHPKSIMCGAKPGIMCPKENAIPEECLECAFQCVVRYGMLEGVTGRMMRETGYEYCGEDYVFTLDCPIYIAIVKEKQIDI